MFTNLTKHLFSCKVLRSINFSHLFSYEPRIILFDTEAEVGESLFVRASRGIAVIFLAGFFLEALQGDNGFSRCANRNVAIAGFLLDAEVIRIPWKGIVPVSGEREVYRRGCGNGRG